MKRKMLFTDYMSQSDADRLANAIKNMAVYTAGSIFGDKTLLMFTGKGNNGKTTLAKFIESIHNHVRIVNVNNVETENQLVDRLVASSRTDNGEFINLILESNDNVSHNALFRFMTIMTGYSVEYFSLTKTMTSTDTQRLMDTNTLLKQRLLDAATKKVRYLRSLYENSELSYGLTIEQMKNGNTVASSYIDTVKMDCDNSLQSLIVVTKQLEDLKKEFGMEA